MSGSRILSWAVAVQACVFVSCEQPVVEQVGSPSEIEDQRTPAPAVVHLPVDRIITDNQGRELDVTIVGKSDTEITFNRKSDGREYSLSIGSLSNSDRAFLSNVIAREVEKSEPDARPDEIDPARTRLDNLEQAISRVNDEIEVLRLKMTGLSSNSPRARGYQKEISRLHSEIVDLKVQMKRIEQN